MKQRNNNIILQKHTVLMSKTFCYKSTILIIDTRLYFRIFMVLENIKKN